MPTKQRPGELAVGPKLLLAAQGGEIRTLQLSNGKGKPGFAEHSRARWGRRNPSHSTHQQTLGRAVLMAQDIAQHGKGQQGIRTEVTRHQGRVSDKNPQPQTCQQGKIQADASQRAVPKPPPSATYCCPPRGDTATRCSSSSSRFWEAIRAQLQFKRNGLKADALDTPSLDQTWGRLRAPPEQSPEREQEARPARLFSITCFHSEK